jgi:hypothetical protein
VKQRPTGPKLSRRRFVTLVAAGSAAFVASPIAAVTPAVRRRASAAPKPATATLSEADRREIARQRKSTADTLTVIRKHAMPPGTEMAAIFRPRRSARRSG